MSTRNLEALFAPRAIALIGASAEPGSVGAVLARNLLRGGFAGPVMFVNPHESTIEGAPVWRSVADLPQAPDLAVIATPAATVPGLIAELGARGCGAAVVISAGFEGGTGAGDVRTAVLQAAQPHDLRIVGPNCLGVLSPTLGINASFAHRMPDPGGIALVAQSGAVAAAAIDWAPAHGVGFSRIVTIGDSLDVDLGDLIGWLADDAETAAILLYIESISDAPKFMQAARRAAGRKPVAAIKAGRSEAGAKAAFSHTGALAGADAVYDAAFRRAGIVRVDTLSELFDLALAFNAGVAVGAGERLAILTNGGGAGVLAVDALAAGAGRLAELSPATLAALDGAAPPGWSRRNPIDILGDARPERYRAALQTLIAAPEADAVLVLNCPTAVADSLSAAEAVCAAVAESPNHKPVLTAWLGEAGTGEARARLAAAGLPTYEGPEQAVQVLARLAEAGRRRAEAEAAPAKPSRAPDAAAAILARATAEQRAVLTDPEARGVLRAYGVPVVQSLVAADPEAAGVAARRLGGPVVLKILSRQISHKTEVGGVALGLPGPADVELAARDMLARVRVRRPDAVIEGFVVEPMIERPLAEEILVGLTTDATFGPVVAVAHGGVAAEVRADRSLELPPLDLALAGRMVGRTRVSRLLAGYRGRPAADVGALGQVLVALGRIALELPQVAELDINPLLCDAAGVLAVDARIALHADARPPPAVLGSSRAARAARDTRRAPA